jgi:hypothetical protein
MADKSIIAGGKIYSLEKCSGNVPDGKLREMYAYNLIMGVKPTDQVERGIRDTYQDLRIREKSMVEAGVHNPTIVPIKLIVGDEEELNTGGKDQVTA